MKYINRVLLIITSILTATLIIQGIIGRIRGWEPEKGSFVFFENRCII